MATIAAELREDLRKGTYTVRTIASEHVLCATLLTSEVLHTLLQNIEGLLERGQLRLHL